MPIRTTTFVGICVALTLSTAALAQPAVPLERLLKSEPTPGTIALLVEHGDRPETLARLDAALAHNRSEVRAAAARVAFALEARSLVPAIATAFAKETDADAAVEMTRMLATFGDAARDPELIAAWTRVGPMGAGRVAAAYAAARGPLAVNAWKDLRALNDNPFTLAVFLQAADPSSATLLSLLESAVDARESSMEAAILTLARHRSLIVADAALVRALDSAQPPAVRYAAAEHLFKQTSSRISPALLTLLANDAPFVDDPTHIDNLLLHEFARRAQGAPPTQSPAWLAQFDDRDHPVFDWTVAPQIALLLTDLERQRSDKRWQDAKLTEEPTRRPPNPELHLLAPYPRGFVPDLLAEVGCQIKRNWVSSWPAGAADLAVRPDGGTSHVAIIKTGIQHGACLKALKPLFLSHVVPTRVTRATRRTVVLPFDHATMECREAQLGDGYGAIVGFFERIRIPIRTQRRQAAIPIALKGEVQGIVEIDAVVGTQGCVQLAQVVSSVRPVADLSALIAVSGNQFVPAQIGKTPVPLRVTFQHGFKIH